MSVHRSWSHQVELTPEAGSVSHARGFVAGHLIDHGLAHLVDDVVLVVSELATNALVHARSPFLVTLAAVDEMVLLEVRDATHTAPTRVAARTLDTSGRGMAIVQTLSRDWGVSAPGSGGKSVWAQFDVDAGLGR
jgi:hypothetical protein